MDLTNIIRVLVVKGCPSLGYTKGQKFFVEMNPMGPGYRGSFRYTLKTHLAATKAGIGLFGREQRSGEFNLNNGDPTKVVRLRVIPMPVIKV